MAGRWSPADRPVADTARTDGYHNFSVMLLEGPSGDVGPEAPRGSLAKIVVEQLVCGQRRKEP